MLSFAIKDLPKMPNSILRKHWSVVKKEKDKWHKLVRLFVNNKIPKEPLRKAKLTLVRHSTQEPDYDGLVGSFKWVIDALVESGVLIDDKYSVIGQSNYKWEKSKQKEQRIEVVVEEIC